MSDTSEETIKSDQLDKEEYNICRDFARGICDRKFCKYKHENESKMTLNFCHDFQNSICQRPNCKFIHCSPEEEIEYKRTSIMCNHILAEATRKNQLPGSLPICNQFRKGLCRRQNCKYRHMSKEEEDAEIMELIQNNASKKNIVCLNNGTISESQLVQTNELHKRSLPFEEFDECGVQFPKRRLITICQQDLVANNDLHTVDPNRIRPIFKGYFAGTPPPPMLNRVDARYAPDSSCLLSMSNMKHPSGSRTLMLEEENNFLHKEIAQLKRQVSDLTATNEFLLDQNANLRVSNKRNDGVNMPAVSIPNANSPQVIRTVTASVATVPVSLATVSTCNPVSVSIAGCPTVSMAPPAQILAPSQQILVTTNPTTQLAIANSSQAQLAIAQQNLANNLAQQAQPQLTTQAQQLALATTTQQLALANTSQQLTSQPQQLTLANSQQTHQQLNQQLTSQAQQLATQQLTSQAQQLANQQLTSQAQQLANQQLTSQAQQLANQQLTSQAQQLANQQLTSQAQQLANQQLTSQAQQLALANTQQLTSQAQQLALASTTQQLTSQAQQLALANTPQHLTVASVPQQLAMASTNQQLLAQQNLATNQQMEMHRNNQMNGINTSQAMAMSNTTQPMVSYPIMTQSMSHALTH